MGRPTEVSSRGRTGLIVLAFVAFLSMPLGTGGLHSLEPVSSSANPAVLRVFGLVDTAVGSKVRRVPIVHNQRGDAAVPIPKVSSVLSLAAVLVLLLGFVLLAMRASAVPELAVLGGVQSRAPPLVS